jgi:hypothetical protein
MKTERKKYSNSRKHPGLQKKTSRMMIKSYYPSARGSHVSEFEMKDHDLMQLEKQMDGAQIF